MIVDRIKDIISSIRKLSGYKLIFRPRNKNIGLEFEYSWHAGPLCGILKKEMAETCDIDCGSNIEKQLLVSNKPYLKICHAGAYELVMPVLSPTGCEGHFFLGPSVLPGKSFVYKKYYNEYRALPAYEREKYAMIEKLLSVFSSFLLVEHEKMSINDITGAIADDKILKAAELIKKRINQPVKAYELAKECGLSRWYFLHLFKRNTGMPVSMFIKKIKLERAKTLLSSTNLKVISIIKETGYENENNFFIAFKKYTGLTPGKYRASAKKNIRI